MLPQQASTPTQPSFPRDVPAVRPVPKAPMRDSSTQPSSPLGMPVPMEMGKPEQEDWCYAVVCDPWVYVDAARDMLSTIQNAPWTFSYSWTSSAYLLACCARSQVQLLLADFALPSTTSVFVLDSAWTLISGDRHMFEAAICSLREKLRHKQVKTFRFHAAAEPGQSSLEAVQSPVVNSSPNMRTPCSTPHKYRSPPHHDTEPDDASDLYSEPGGESAAVAGGLAPRELAPDFKLAGGDEALQDSAIDCGSIVNELEAVRKENADLRQQLEAKSLTQPPTKKKKRTIEDSIQRKKRRNRL